MLLKLQKRYKCWTDSQELIQGWYLSVKQNGAKRRKQHQQTLSDFGKNFKNSSWWSLWADLEEDCSFELLVISSSRWYKNFCVNWDPKIWLIICFYETTPSSSNQSISQCAAGLKGYGPVGVPTSPLWVDANLFWIVNWSHNSSPSEIPTKSGSTRTSLGVTVQFTNFLVSFWWTGQHENNALFNSPVGPLFRALQIF